MALISETKEENGFEKAVWSVDKDIIPNRTWQWWFWLFFIKGGKKPRQLMTLWSSKESKHLTVNDEPMIDGGIKSRGENEDRFKGAVATWFFNGKNMNHYFKQRYIFVRRGNPNEIATEHGEHVFSGKLDDFRVTSKNPDYDFTLKQTQMKEDSYDTAHYPFGMNFKIAKANRCDLKGTLEGEDVEGYGYFQKVTCNAPATSWYWDINYFEKDAILSYFKPVLGRQSINFSGRHVAPFDITLNKDCFLHTGKEKLNFGNFSLKRTGGELPVWKLEGKGTGGTISAELTTYARACWKFKQNWMGIPSVLHYNEYPTTVTKLDINGGDITLDDLGPNYGNTEHSWGILF